MRDGERQGRVQSLRVAFVQHGLNFIPLKPARRFKFLGINYNIISKRLADQPDHQARGKGPWLVRMEPDVANPDARFLENFPPCCFFNRLARLHETGKRRIHALRPSALPPQKHAGSMAHGNDDHRIRARKMIRGTGRAVAALARIAHFSLHPAIGAKPVVLMPMQQGTGLGENGKLSLWQHPRHRKAA